VAQPGQDASVILQRSLSVHGGDAIDQLERYQVDMTGQWDFLITRIQPLVSDYRYRVDSREVYYPNERKYQVNYTGPAGTKQVERTPTSISVAYDNTPSQDPDVLQSTALTADAFFIYSLPMLTVHDKLVNPVLLDQRTIDGQVFHVVHAEMRPGMGYADRDEIVLWIHPESYRVHRVQTTLNGYRTTQGAHVEITYLEFAEHGPLVVPTRFIEYVRGPVNIRAHRWQFSNPKLVWSSSQ
jgi:hypothetical protein